MSACGQRLLCSPCSRKLRLLFLRRCRCGVRASVFCSYMWLNSLENYARLKSDSTNFACMHVHAVAGDGLSAGVYHCPSLCSVNHTKSTSETVSHSHCSILFAQEIFRFNAGWLDGKWILANIDKCNFKIGMTRKWSTPDVYFNLRYRIYIRWRTSR